MAITTEQIKELREISGAGIMDCREALTTTDGDLEKAVEILREKGLAKASKRADREASEGVVELYNHGNGRVGVMVEVNCETDFVSKGDDFRNFAHELALHIAASSPLWVSEEDIDEEILEQVREEARTSAKEEGKPDNIIEKIVEGKIAKYKNETVLLNQPYVRDDEITVQDLLNANVAKLGENVIIRRFARWELGELSNADEDEETEEN